MDFIQCGCCAAVAQQAASLGPRHSPTSNQPKEPDCIYAEAGLAELTGGEAEHRKLAVADGLSHADQGRSRPAPREEGNL
jgi:hypothetical protein